MKIDRVRRLSPELQVEHLHDATDVLDVALDADKLLALAQTKIALSETASCLMEGWRFVRSFVQPSRVRNHGRI